MALKVTGTAYRKGKGKRHSLPFQEEAVLKYLVVALTFALDCTYLLYVVVATPMT